jgi:hypothetical protein
VLASAAIYTTTAGTASAGWFVEGSELTGTAALATTASVDENFKLTAAGITIECTGSTLNSASPELKAPNLIAASSLTFSECKSTPSEPCTLATKTISTVALLAELSGLAFPEVKAIFAPKTKTTFATIKFNGSECALAGTQPINGKATTTLLAGQEEKTFQQIKVKTTKGEFKLGSSEAELTGAALLKLISGAPFTQAPNWTMVVKKGGMIITTMKKNDVAELEITAPPAGGTVTAIQDTPDPPGAFKIDKTELSLCQGIYGGGVTCPTKAKVKDEKDPPAKVLILLQATGGGWGSVSVKGQ